MNFKIPNNIQLALDILHKNNFEAYLVGGCVRDFLMNIEPKDYDITTNALPNQIKEVFKDYKLINNNGEKHGTVTVFIEEPIEITTYRGETTYSDHRHPDEVIFKTELKDDLSRRDFTINAMAYDGNKLVDLFMGEDHIILSQLHAVGDPDERFREDALRILRGIRFASRYKMSIGKKTLEAMHKNKHLLDFISKERIRTELNKMISYEYFAVLLETEVRDIISYILPEISVMFDYDQRSLYHTNDLWHHTLSTMFSLNTYNYIVKVAALLHDVGKPYVATEYEKDGVILKHYIDHAEKSYEIATGILDRLKYSNEEKEKILFLIRYHDFNFSTKRLNRSMKKFIQLIPEKYRDELFELFLELKFADNRDHTINFPKEVIDELQTAYNSIVNNEICFSLKQLAINGNDLLKLGYKGILVGIILNDCLEKVVSDELENGKSKLLDFVLNKYKEI